MLGLIVVAVVIFFVVKFVLKKQNEPEEKQKVICNHFDSRPSRLVYGVNPLANISKPCPDNLKQPVSSIIKFRFYENKTKDFYNLLEIIKGNPNLKKENNIYDIFFPFSDWQKIKQVFDIVKKWKKTEIFINEEIADNKNLAKLLKCLTDKEKNGSSDWCEQPDLYEGNYPSNIGCRRLDVGYGFTCKPWYDYLILEKDYFKINKEEILNQILTIAKTCKHCPFFESQKIWENYLKIPPAISFNDKRFLCLQWANGKLEAYPRFPDEPLNEAIFSNFTGRVLSKK